MEPWPGSSACLSSVVPSSVLPSKVEINTASRYHMLQASSSGFSSVAVYENHPHQNKPNLLETKLEQRELAKLPKNDFLMGVISVLIPTWKMMRNCHMIAVAKVR